MTDNDNAEIQSLPPPRKRRRRAAPKTKPIETLVIEIRGLMLDVTTAESNLNKKRLSAGQRLLELRTRIQAGEAGDVSWWDFYKEHLASFRSRKDAEKLMRMAGADDPEATIQAERVEAKERMRRHRAENVGANVRSIQPDVEDAEYLVVGECRRASTRVKAFTEGFLNTVDSLGVSAEIYSTDEALDLLTREESADAVETMETSIASQRKVVERLKAVLTERWGQ